MRTRRRPAFTIVELLVVIAIIALLVGILLPALAAAQKRSLKGREVNRLRQVGIAWQLYTNSNKEMLLPGFLDREVQRVWRVSSSFPDGTPVPPAPTFQSTDNNVAGPWPWRLASYMDFSHDALHGYADEPEFDVLELSQTQESREIALHPTFGYNAYYVGGWWEIGANGRPLYKFADAKVDPSGGTSYTAEAPVVSRSMATIRRSTELVVFAPSATLEPGLHRDIPDNIDGYHLVVPPILANDQQWKYSGGLEIFATQYAPVAAPIGRYSGVVPTLNADGHTASNTAYGLEDMRLWVDRAVSKEWTHE